MMAWQRVDSCKNSFLNKHVRFEGKGETIVLSGALHKTSAECQHINSHGKPMKISV